MPQDNHNPSLGEEPHSLKDMAAAGTALYLSKIRAFQKERKDVSGL